MERSKPKTKIIKITICNSAIVFTALSYSPIDVSDSSQRLATEGNESLSPSPIFRVNRNFSSRRRRDYIRSEILRILTSSNFHPHRGSQDAYILRNLHLL